jgi:general stress protein CsbA
VDFAKLPLSLIQCLLVAFSVRNFYDDYNRKEVYPLLIPMLSALIMPCLLVLLFTRVTYNRVIGLILTVALIAASVYKGYAHTWPVMIIDAFSLTVGFWLAAVMKKRAAVKES